MRNASVTFDWTTLRSVLVLVLTGCNSQSSVLAASGPSSVDIRYEAVGGEVVAGFSTTFHCFSTCVPRCTYAWSLDALEVNGSVLTLTPDGLDSVLVLKCTALNPGTGNSIKHTVVLNIANRVSVQISPQHILPSVTQPQSLVCQGAARGLPVVWYKDGQTVTLDQRISLLEYNTTLHFDSLMPSDAGFYNCKATMPSFEKHTAFSLGYLLNFDPWKVSISGPDTVLPGQKSAFICQTSCTINVDCTIKWQFRGGFPIGLHLSTNGNALKWTPSIPGTFQNITCVAENAAAHRSAEATKMVEVVGVPPSRSEMVQPSGLLGLMLSLGLTFLFDF